MMGRTEDGIAGGAEIVADVEGAGYLGITCRSICM